jgi:UDP-N-acetylmuramoyl-tripeptide--D-alanyl-D-alanine ligase
MAANLCLAPVQGSINLMYRVRAGRKLKRLAPMVVGITGSYGKTSTKYFTEALLEPRFRVLKTRASFNTILGVCRAINEELGPEHKVMIVEMGAYRRGEIRDMARLVKPHIGVLTAIGPQHLERFGSIETIEKAKFELLEALAPDDIAVINNDDPRIRRLAGAKWLPNVQRYGIDAANGAVDLAAEDISHGPDGLSFTMVERNGTRTPMKTRLIGLHNVSNILAAATVAKAAGVSPQEMARAVGRLQPVPHRLEVHTDANGVTIIDDAYNSNPVGAFNALDALAEFQTGRKVLVTPGMVELGVEQDARNEEFGAKAAKTCDFVILVGTRQTIPIRRGLESAGFEAGHITSVRNLNEGLEALKGIVRAGDVVLFENDLPDLYEE